MQLRESLLHGENNDYDVLNSPTEKNENDYYDSADHDFGPSGFDMPENADMNSDATPFGEKVGKLDMDVFPYINDYVSLKLVQSGLGELQC